MISLFVSIFAITFTFIIKPFNYFLVDFFNLLKIFFHWSEMSFIWHQFIIFNFDDDDDDDELFLWYVDWRKACSLISSWDHCQRSSPPRITDMPQEGFEPVQNPSSGLIEWSCTIMITTTPWRHKSCLLIFQFFMQLYVNVLPADYN